ncbi:fetal and adult testis-expressed transcript protein [Fukomys damarensis]|uniref:fetal and adult testis-expressed transcript protein n=1 Tax=Fukomys damarensis TaxID=885580 RepID=UPI0005401BEC|nr:fetal and adult testis-expressed transcript protein [Fukomys damarensis]
MTGHMLHSYPGRHCASPSSAWHLVHSQLSHPTEQPAAMAAGPSNIGEEVEMCIEEELALGSHRQGQGHPMIADTLDHGPRSLGVSQRHQKVERKAAVSILAQSPWNRISSRTKRVEHQEKVPRMSREAGHGDAHFQENRFSFQGHNDLKLGIDLLAELGLGEFSGLEMEILRRQLLVITERVRALEDQNVIWRFKEAVFFTLMISSCIVNIWLWMHQ